MQHLSSRGKGKSVKKKYLVFGTLIENSFFLVLDGVGGAQLFSASFFWSFRDII